MRVAAAWRRLSSCRAARWSRACCASCEDVTSDREPRLMLRCVSEPVKLKSISSSPIFPLPSTSPAPVCEQRSLWWEASHDILEGVVIHGKLTSTGFSVSVRPSRGTHPKKKLEFWKFHRDGKRLAVSTTKGSNFLHSSFNGAGIQASKGGAIQGEGQGSEPRAQGCWSQART